MKNEKCFRCSISNIPLIHICKECREMNPFCYFQCQSSSHRHEINDFQFLEYKDYICQKCMIELHTTHLCLSNCCEHEIPCEILQK